MKVEKLIRNNMVAVLISPGFGAGWSSWNLEHKDSGMLLFDRRLVELAERQDWEAFEAKAIELTGDEGLYFGGMEDVKVQWVLQGTRFYVHEYDGSEHIVTEEEFEIA